MNKLTFFKILWYKNNYFFYLLIILLTIGTFPFFIFDKISFFIFLKHWHHPIADSIVPYLTYLGNTFIYIFFLPIFILLCTSYRKFIIIIVSFIFMSINVQLLKRFFFKNMLRPIALLPKDVSIHLVDGIYLLKNKSFPSGHAATIFLFISITQLLYINKNKIYSTMLLVLALIVSYSRIYLCQHFYIDVYIGALIGILSSIVVYTFFIYYNKSD